MAFSRNTFGALVDNDSAKAHAKLVSLFAKHGTREAVAEALSVNARTLARWLKKLEHLGDPRSAKRRPAASLEVRRQALALRDEGIPADEIATRLGFPKRTVARWFSRAPKAA